MLDGDIGSSFYGNPNAVVYPDHVPYRGPIPGGLHEGKLVEIKGHVPYGADVFQVNLLTGLDTYSDTALHISVRFNGCIVVRNAKQQNVWGPEDRTGLFPFSTGQDFSMLILVDPSAYRIAVNNQHCWEFHHRLPHTRVSSIYIDGNVQLERIEFVDKITPYQRPGTCNPWDPPIPVYPGGCIIPGIQQPVCSPMQPSYVIPPPPERVVCPPAVMQPSSNLSPVYNPGIRQPVCPPMQPSYVLPPPPERVVCPPAVMQPSSNLSPVYNPPIPYAYPIDGGLKPGMMIYISGRPSASPYKFTINLQSGTAAYPPPDIAFHFDVRFYNCTVVRNSRTNNVWSTEEVAISHFPFQPAVNFDMIIRIEGDKYMIALNGQHFIEFRHRLTPLSRFDTLYIENDIVVSSIRFA